MAMFNQFHDILPGSGVHDTYAHSQGLFQEIQAIACSVRTRALRRLAAQIDTSTAIGIDPQNGSAGESLGSGAGDIMPGGVSSRAAGASPVEPLVVFNPLAYPRSEVITAKVWNRNLPHDRIIVRDDEGNTIPGQVTGAGAYWGHEYKAVTFPVRNIPGMGYRTYSIGAAPEPVMKIPTYADPGPTDIAADSAPPAPGEVKIPAPYVMENEFLKVEVDPASGAVAHLVDKSSGYDLVPEGELMGLLELHREIPHAMTAWNIGVVSEVQKLDRGGMLTGTRDGACFPISSGGKAHVPEYMPERGPHRASIRVGHKLGDSRIRVEVGLSGGSRTIDFRIEADWREIGTSETGVPMLRIAFPTNLQKTLATYEIPFGSVQRPVDGHEVPALSWADLSGSRAGAEGSGGITLLNIGKYGHSADESTLRLTLLRSSYDPDPVPEVGYHDIRLGLLVHDGPCSVSESAMAGAAFNQPVSIVPTDIHKGSLPVRKGFAEVMTPNVMLSALKKSEDSEAVIIRLYEMEGRETEAQVRLAGIVEPSSPAVEIDLMEQPLPASSARMDGDLLTVKIPAHGIASVKIG
jgi:alpha-mannosidase